MPVSIRAARLPEDKPVILKFIQELQRFEQAIESDRRIDDAVADDAYAVIAQRVAERHGCMLIAEDAHRNPLGWAAAYEATNEIYVVAEERTYGYISELYVDARSRGRGIGRALMAACEAWGKERGLKVMMIAALANNSRAHGAYVAAGFQHYATELRKYLR